MRFTSRTRGSELFINQLMTLCFAFELEGLARNCRYLDRIEDTHLIRQVSSAIEIFRDEVRQRPPRRIPHGPRQAAPARGFVARFHRREPSRLDLRSVTDMIG
ncbi:hypothetical protein GCM10015535_52860 [Streptomyces gelaticus]|uniref:Tn3 transposase DDE domain-containing protein n=1 Tax=Streptomyces gelaticus TaxID=285446 RepID=A0ABQ2W5F6_9ACTN|nr:hypothetical protein GCM10015535_52860 [Streptomyces gelaticus]